MESFLIRALQLICCFSILIFLHEGGHFLAAKLFKVRVEKFCLFFDPWLICAKRVAPFTGAWIEIPSGSRGCFPIRRVAPFTGAWIEIKNNKHKKHV